MLNKYSIFQCQQKKRIKLQQRSIEIKFISDADVVNIISEDTHTDTHGYIYIYIYLYIYIYIYLSTGYIDKIWTGL